jgi:hypothetical protein
MNGWYWAKDLAERLDAAGLKMELARNLLRHTEPVSDYTEDAVEQRIQGASRTLTDALAELGAEHDYESKNKLETGPWGDGSEASFVPWTDGWAVGYCATVNGVKSYIYLNPSSGGDSPDVFVYAGPHGDPGRDAPQVFVTPDGVKEPT